MCTDHEQRYRFADALLAHARSGTHLAMGIRSDYWADLAFHPELAERVVATSVLLGPLRDDDVRLVVREGARRGGLEADDDLVEAIVTDAGHEVGILPHLSTALTQTWMNRDGQRLRRAGYDSAGGLLGALAHGAESVWAGLDDESRGAARVMLLRLASAGTEGRILRRRISRAELVGDEPVAQRALDVMIEGRLLVSGDEGVEVAHESLFRGWPRLAGWLADDAAARRVRAAVARAADEWVSGGRLDTDLLRGPRLVEGVRLLESRSSSPGPNGRSSRPDEMRWSVNALCCGPRRRWNGAAAGACGCCSSPRWPYWSAPWSRADSRCGRAEMRGRLRARR